MTPKDEGWPRLTLDRRCYVRDAHMIVEWAEIACVTKRPEFVNGAWRVCVRTVRTRASGTPPCGTERYINPARLVPL